jgi:hypothetical protein
MVSRGCPESFVGAALALPYADTDMMQLHLDEISLGGRSAGEPIADRSTSDRQTN